jgi:glycosyltransferase involved in cell wall biosynthesis
VLDAGSTDETPDVLRAYLGTYGLTAWTEPDEGQADALNRGFDRARGDVFCWLNADDLWLHERVVEEAVAALETGVDVVTAGGSIVDADGRRDKAIPVHPERVLRELRWYDTLLQPATFWRASMHRRLRTDLHYTFAWQLFLDMRDAGARFAAVDREWAGYRMHAVNKTAADPARRRAEVAEILRVQCGPRSPQHLWAASVHRAYLLAERRRIPALKRAVQLANSALFLLSRRRVVSC